MDRRGLLRGSAACPGSSVISVDKCVIELTKRGVHKAGTVKRGLVRGSAGHPGLSVNTAFR
jgi:hypothetical protein